MLKRIESSIVNNSVKDFSNEFSLEVSDYSDIELSDINNKLLAIAENKHDFFSITLNSTKMSIDNNIEIEVNLAYKNIDDKEGFQEDTKMILGINDNGSFYVAKIFFITNEQ